LPRRWRAREIRKRVEETPAGESAYAIQFHFEVTREEIAAWCDETPDLEEGWGTSKEKLMRRAEDSLAPQQEAGKEATRRFLERLG
jgi:GMP synthase-like glutamine amidotransferase